MHFLVQSKQNIHMPIRESLLHNCWSVIQVESTPFIMKTFKKVMCHALSGITSSPSQWWTLGNKYGLLLCWFFELLMSRFIVWSLTTMKGKFPMAGWNIANRSSFWVYNKMWLVCIISTMSCCIIYYLYLYVSIFSFTEIYSVRFSLLARFSITFRKHWKLMVLMEIS